MHATVEPFARPAAVPAVDLPVPDLAPGHQAITVTRGCLPHGAAWLWLAEESTLIVAVDLSAAGVARAFAEVLGARLR